MSEQIIPYDKFTTGYTYREISEMIWSYSDDPRDWHLANATGHISKRTGKRVGNRRHAILGKWREIKQEMYERYLNAIQQGGGVDEQG